MYVHLREESGFPFCFVRFERPEEGERCWEAEGRRRKRTKGSRERETEREIPLRRDLWRIIIELWIYRLIDWSVMDEVITAADASSNSQSTSSAPYILPSNFPLLSAFLAFALAQFLKLFTTWFKEKRWDSRRMLGSGGMPSSHSATVTALAVAIGLQEGTGGSAFALAVVMASVVMYDATGVRLHAGRQAELLNQIVCELPPEHPVSNVRPLRDSLGHTPLQVIAGAILGCIVAYLLRNSS